MSKKRNDPLYRPKCSVPAAISSVERYSFFDTESNSETTTHPASSEYLDDVMFVGIFGEIPVSSVDDYGDNL